MWGARNPRLTCIEALKPGNSVSIAPNRGVTLCTAS